MCVCACAAQSFEALNQRAVAVVVDPVQSVKGKVVIDAFRLISPQVREGSAPPPRLSMHACMPLDPHLPAWGMHRRANGGMMGVGMHACMHAAPSASASAPPLPPCCTAQRRRMCSPAAWLPNGEMCTPHGCGCGCCCFYCCLSDHDAGAGAPPDNVQLGPPEQTLHPGAHPRPQQALLLHRHQLPVRHHSLSSLGGVQHGCTARASSRSGVQQSGVPCELPRDDDDAKPAAAQKTAGGELNCTRAPACLCTAARTSWRSACCSTCPSARGPAAWGCRTSQ